MEKMGGKTKRDRHAKACKRGRAIINARSGHGEPCKVLTCQPRPQGPAALPRPKISVYTKASVCAFSCTCTLRKDVYAGGAY